MNYPQACLGDLVWIGHLPDVPLIQMIDAMSVVKRDIMLMIVIAIADDGEAGIYFKEMVGVLVNQVILLLARQKLIFFI